MFAHACLTCTSVANLPCYPRQQQALSLASELLPAPSVESCHGGRLAGNELLVQQVMGLLVYTDPADSPVAHLLTDAFRDDTAACVNDALLRTCAVSSHVMSCSLAKFSSSVCCACRHTSEHSMLEHTHRKFCGAPSPPPVPPRAPSGATSVSNGAGLIPASPLVVPMRARGPSDASVDSADAAAALSSWHMEPGAGLAAQGLAAAVGRGGGLGGAQILAPSSVIAWLQASGAGSTATAAARRHRASSGGDSSAATTESDMVSDVSAAVRSYCVRACADVLWCGVVMLLLALPFPSAWREAAIKQQRSR